MNKVASGEILPKRSFQSIKNPVLDFSSQRTVDLQRVKRIKISSWRIESSQTELKSLKNIRESFSTTKKCRKVCLEFTYYWFYSVRYFLQIQQIFERSHYLQDIQLRNCDQRCLMGVFTNFVKA